MKQQLFIFIGGSDEQNGDYSGVHRLARRGGTARWGCIKTARPGDRVLIYIQRPNSALTAKAEVLGAPVKGKPGDYAYRAKLGRFELLPNQVSLDDLKRQFPRWGWLLHPGKVLVPPTLADRLWSLVHEKQSRVQILIRRSDDHQDLQRLAETGKTEWHYAPKLTAVGDTVLFYETEPTSAVVATGTALSGTRPSPDKWYTAKVGKVRLLDAPIALHELRKLFPDWAWLRSVNMFAYVSPDRAKRLLKRLTERKPFPRQQPAAGGGLGNPETNPLVERAAVNEALRYLQREGYQVVSRERDKIGYDLDATRGTRSLHVEVKGVTGGELQFPITAGEVRRAQEDGVFRLFVVTNATGPTPRLTSFTGPQLLSKFRLVPLGYMARPL